MKKTLVLVLAILSLACFAGMASAQTPAATPAATTSTAAAKAPTAQQNRMKTCAAKYHAQNIPKNQYHSFMSTCMKNPAKPTTPPTPGSPPTTK